MCISLAHVFNIKYSFVISHMLIILVNNKYIKPDIVCVANKQYWT